MSDVSPSLVTRLTQRRGVRQFVKFGIVGASGFIVNLVLFTILQSVFPSSKTATLPYDVIYSVAFLSGGVSNYFLNRIWTFRSTGHAGREGLQFLSVSALALVVAFVVINAEVLRPYLGHGHRLWFVATLAGIVVNFFVNKYWTFRKT
jgi:putative flippase GtrA